MIEDSQINEQKAAGRKPKFMTAFCYPNKLPLDKFVADISDSIPIFKKNMENLGLGSHEMYVEEWMDRFTDWMEMEKGNWD